MNIFAKELEKIVGSHLFSEFSSQLVSRLNKVQKYNIFWIHCGQGVYPFLLNKTNQPNL